MTSAGTAYVDVRGDLTTLTSQLAAALAPGRLSPLAKRAGLAIGAGLAVGAAGKGLFDLGAKFDAEFDKIRVGTGKTGIVLDRLEDDFRSVVKSVPGSFDDAGVAVSELGRRTGLSGKSLRALSKQILQLSRITKTDVGQNVAAVTRLFGDWSVATDDQAEFLNKLFRVGQETGIQVGDLSRLMVKFGSPLRSLGFDFEEAAAMFARFEREGVNIQTTLPGFKLALRNFAQPTKELAASFKELGINAAEPREAIKQVFEAIKTLPKREATQLAFDVFGSRAATDMARAVKEGRFEFDELIASMRDGSETIDKAETNTRDFGEQWDLLKKRVFVGLEPLATGVFDTLGDAMEVLANPDLSGAQKWDRISTIIGSAFDKAFEAAAQGAERFGPKIAAALFKGFVQAPGLVQLVTGAWIFAKGRKLLTAFGVLGTQAGAAFGAGVGTGTAGGAAVGGLTGLAGRLKGFAKTGAYTAVGVAAADAVLSGMEVQLDKGSGDLSKRLTGLGKGTFESALKGPLGKDAAFGLDELFGTGGDSDAVRLREILADIQQKHEAISAETATEALNLAKQLDLTEQQRKKIGQIVDVGRQRAAVEKLRREVGAEGVNIKVNLDTPGRSTQLLRSLQLMREGVFTSMRDINREVATNTERISQTLGTGTEKGRQALAENFRQAVVNIGVSMRDGEISTKAGIARIKELMRSAKLVEGDDPLGIGRGLARSVERAGGVTREVRQKVVGELKLMPPQAREQAVQTMLLTTAEFERKKKLPEGSTRQMKALVLGQFRDLKTRGAVNAAQFVSNVSAVFGGLPMAAQPGLAGLFQLIQGALTQLGAKAKLRLPTIKEVATGVAGIQKFAAGQARGGFLAGPGLRDTVPVMAAPGEAFLTRHQQAPVDRALRTTYGYGLDDLFKRQKKPHYMATGGRVERFRTGGKVGTPSGIVPIPGQPGEFIHSSILKDVLALIKRYRLRVTDGYAPSGHAAAGEHPKGLAADAIPGPSGSWDLVDKLAAWAEPRQNQPRAPFRWVGYTGDAGHGRGDHLHLSWGGGGGVDVEIPELGRIAVRGLGATRDLVQAAVDRTRQAGQRFLDRQVGTAPVGTETDPGEGAVGSGAGLMRKIAKQRGWNFGHWWKLDEKETSHGRNLANPDSTARLRGQFLDMNYGKYGPGSDPAQSPSMAQQIRSMARYIAERYGNPTRALAFHNKNNYYERGGFVDFLEAATGVVAAEKKSKPPKGLKKPPKYTGKRHELKPKTKKTKSRLPSEIIFPELDSLNFLRNILAGDGVIATIQDRIGGLETQFGLTDEDFYPDERTIPRLQKAGRNIQKLGDSFIDWTAVGERKDEIGRLLGESYQLIGQPFGVPPGWMEIAKDSFAPMTEAVQGFINRLKDEIAALKKRVSDNVKQIRRLEKRIDDEKDDIESREKLIDKEQGKEKPDREKIDRWRDRNRESRDKITDWGKTRDKLSDQNRELAGKKFPGNLDDITEGRLGETNLRLDNSDPPGAVQLLESLQSDKTDLLGLSGIGGTFASQNADIQGLVNELGTLSTERITEAVAPVTATDTKAQDQQTFLNALRELFKTFGSNIALIPKFAKGGLAKGLALVGEEGYELAKLPGGKLEVLGHQGPEIRELPGGTRVFSHPETKRKLGTDRGRESLRPIVSGASESLTTRRFSERFTSQARITEKLKIPAFAQGGIVKPFAQGGVIEPPQARVQDGQVVLDPRQLKLLIDQLKESKKEVNIDARPQFKEQPTDAHGFSKSLAFELKAAI